LSVAGGDCTTGDKNGDTCSILITDNVGNSQNCVSPANEAEISGGTEFGSAVVEVTVEVGAGLGLVCDPTIVLDTAYVEGEAATVGQGVIVGYGTAGNNLTCAVFTNDPGDYQVAVDEINPLILQTPVEGEDENLTEDVSDPTAQQQFIPLTEADTGVFPAAAAWGLRRWATLPNSALYSGAGLVIYTGTGATDPVTGSAFKIEVKANIDESTSMQPGKYRGNFVVTATAI
jgi:hypothetical protein